MRAKEKLDRDLMGDTSAREQTAAGMVGAAAASLVPITLAVALLAGMLAFAFGLDILLVVPVFMLVSFSAVLIQRVRLRGQVHLPLNLPEPNSYADSAAHDGAARLIEARRKVVASFRRGGQSPRVMRGVSQLEARALTLMARLEYLGSCLAGCPTSQLESEVARLGAGRAKLKDEAARKAYERATSACAERLEIMRRLRVEQDVARATLDHVLGTLDGVPARVARLRLMEIELCTGPVSESHDDVSRLREEFDLLEAACSAQADSRAQPRESPDER